MPLRPFARRRPFRAGLERLETRLALSLSIQVDYSYDSLGFFTTNPAAKTVLQEAAQILGSQINDSLAAIVPDGGNVNTWSQDFTDPSTGLLTSRLNPTVPADTIIVYAAGASNSGFAGEGGPGGFSASGSGAWNTLVSTRGVTGMGGSWGGTVSFNTSTAWSFVGTSGSPANNQYDFLTVALHELGHVLGIGTSDQWQGYVNSVNDTFTGPHAQAMYGGPVPLNTAGQFGEAADSHWGTGLLSFGLEPTVDVTPLLPGYRKTFTSLDWAGLQDLGWHVDQALVTTQPPSSTTTGTGFSVIVSIADPDGHVDTTFNGPVTLALGAQPPGGVLTGTLTVSAVNGLASFSGLSLNIPSASYTLVATASQVASATSSIITTSSPSDVGHFLVSAQPPVSVTAGGSFGISLSVLDSSNNPLSLFNGPVTITLWGGPGGASLLGSATVNAVNGLVTFSGLSINKAGNGYLLQASSPTITSATTSAFNVTPAAASKLLITTQPPALVTAGWPFGLTVQVVDSYGNLRTDRSDQITVTLSNNPSGDLLGGVTSIFAQNGIVTFAGFSLKLPATGDTLRVSAGGLSAATTTPFNVVTGVPAQVVVTSQPPASLNTGTPFNVIAEVRDAAGNLSTSFNGTAIISLAANPGGASLTGPLSVNVVGGVARFSGLILNYPGTGYVLQVSFSSGQSTTTNPFGVTGQPGNGGPSQALSIVGISAIYSGKGKKKTLIGFEIFYGSALDGSRALNASNYVMTESIKKGKKTIAKPVGLQSVSGSAANSVRLLISGKHPFLKGGRLVVTSSGPSGITGSNGNFLAGGDATFTILNNGKGIQ